MDGFGNNFQIKVSTDILRAKEDVVTGKVSEMEGGLNEMKQVVMRTANYWIGEGGDARRNSYINQQAFVEEMVKRLKEYPMDLLKMAGIYEEAEKDNEEIPHALSADVIV